MSNVKVFAMEDGQPTDRLNMTHYIDPYDTHGSKSTGEIGKHKPRYAVYTIVLFPVDMIYQNCQKKKKKRPPKTMFLTNIT